LFRAMNKLQIRAGKPEDLKAVLRLIKELAEYERAPDEVSNTESMMLRDGFGNQPHYGILVAELDGHITGTAIHYVRYSTWKGPMLYLEDIIVQEKYRGRGIGSLLFEACATYSREKDYAGMMWQVLAWNTPAINFYKKYNCILDAEWVNGKLTREQIHQITDQIQQS
jgi:ribosomal protein S18 acetylase RimI-like enzyme